MEETKESVMEVILLQDSLVLGKLNGRYSRISDLTDDSDPESNKLARLRR